MAFDPLQMSYGTLEGVINRRTYDYRTTDAITTVIGAGYFAGIGIGGANDRDAQLGDTINVNIVDSLSATTTLVPYECRIQSLDASQNATVTAVGVTTFGDPTGASLVSIEDTGGLYTATNVEDALAEVATDVGALSSAVVLKGTWDASSGSFPGSGSAQSGWSYIVSVSGTVDSVAFTQNDRIVAITNNASTSTYASNWHHLDYTDQVASVDGQTGAVDLSGDYLALADTPVVVASLPGSPSAGQRAIVNDANATTFASVVAAGGANVVPVYYDGSNWRIG